MRHRAAVLALVLCCAWNPLEAQEAGSAGGEGKIEELSFSPHHSYAYSEGTGAKQFTWIVLTEKEPPLKDWATAKNRDEARRVWCEKEKTPFVAVKLDAEWKVDLYFLCPANGYVNTEMLSTWNGLESVVVNFETKDAKRLKGTLTTGSGACSDGDTVAYCTPTGDYTFDAPLLK